MGVTPLPVILALAGLLASGGAANTSVYTRLDEKSCKVIASREQGGFTLQRCRGVNGIDLLRDSFDSRDDVRLVHARGEDPLHLRRVSDSFNSIDQMVEWRMAGTTPVALILRLVVDESDDLERHVPHPFLIVARVRPGASCVVEIIDARTHPDANQRARRFADRSQSAACLWP